MADKRFTIQLDAQMNISQVKTAVQGMQAELNKLKLPPEIGNKIGTTLTNLSGEIERFQAKAAKGIGSSVDFTQISRSGEKIIQLYQQLRNQVGDLGGMSKSQLEKLFPAEAMSNIKKAQSAYDSYTATVKKNGTELEKAQKSYKETGAEVDRLKQKLDQLKNIKPVSDSAMSGWKKGLQEAFEETQELEKQMAQVQQRMQDFLNQKDKNGNERTPSTARRSSQYRDWEEELQRLTERYNIVKAAQADFESKTKSNMTFSKQTSEIKKYEGQLETAQTKLRTLSTTIAEMEKGDTQAFQTLINALNQINGIKLDPAKASIEDVRTAIDKLSKEQADQLRQKFNQLGTTVNGAGSTFNTLGTKIDETRLKVQQLDTKLSEVNALKSRIQYFFGLTNSVYLFRRAVTSAFQTVKELDSAMTETAVVTDFTVSDMWEKLPEYTKNASALGATTKELYNATTLYYQQGLKGSEVMSVGIETMKMARIAGMEAAEATEAMTAALRGFNMEVNETNAVRVNDVYSELAAITAADTEQIATAMTKTASIAANANMEFETTAALLAQIIETTQEAPETAGTAMKTIIARFSEVKELQNQGKKTGQDSEGEEIDVNKIDKALKTVGISMNEFFTGTKGLDEILLELAEKWDTLDFTTQRYIATTAAGSRQQSRFIAMMSDYGRTVELVNAANNSAGASQKQFEKTLDSLEAKLNKLSDAWDEFLMGLANNEFIKTGVDLLTDLLTILNKTINFLSFDGEIPWLKSLLTLGAVLGGLKGGKFLLGKGFDFAFKGLNVQKQTQENLLKKMQLAQENAVHKQEMANQAKEHAARLKAIQEERLAALQTEKEKRIAAIKAEEAEKLAGVSGEKTEEAAAIRTEYAEKVASVEGEFKESQSAILNDKAVTDAKLAATRAEEAAAVAAEEAEAAAAAAGEGTETTAAVTGEGTEAAAAIAGENAEAAAAIAGGIAGGKTKGIGGFFKKNGKAIANIAGIIGAIAVVSAIASVADKSIEKIETADKKLGELGQTEEILIEQSENLKKEIDNFSKNRKNMTDMIKSLKELKKGSSEWASNLHAVRTGMDDIFSTYPELLNYTERVEGVATLTEAGWQKYENFIMEDYYESQIALYANKIAQAEHDKIIAAENLNLETSTITQKEKENIQTSSKTGAIAGGVALGIAGYLGGTALGAKAGAVIGSIAGPLGTIIGAALGAALGLGIGYLVGGGATASKGIAPETINSVAEQALTYDADPNSKDDGIGFVAEGADIDQIKTFLESTEIADEEIAILSDYIAQNAKEFDAHTRAMAYATEKMGEYGNTIGQLEAERRGYGTVVDAYSNISEYVYGRDWTNELATQKAQLISETGGIVTEKERDIVLEYSSVYSAYDPQANSGEGGFIRKDNGEATYLTDDQILDIVAQKRTADILNDRVEKAYNLFDEMGNPDIYGTLLNADSAAALAQELTYNELIDSDVREQIAREKDSLMFLESTTITNLNEAAQFAQLAGYNVGYTVTYTQKAVSDVEHYMNDYEHYGHYLDTRPNANGKQEEYDETITKAVGEDLLGQGLTAEEMAEAYAEGYYEWVNTLDESDLQYFSNEPRDVSYDFNEDEVWRYMLEAYGLNEEEARSYFAGELGSEDKYNMGIVQELENQLTTPDVNGNAIFGENGKLNFLTDANIAAVQKLFNDINALSQLKGIDADKYFYSPLEQIYKSMEGMSIEAKERIVNLFASADARDLSDLRTTEQIIEGYSDVNAATKEAFSDWVDGLEEAGIAVATIDLEALTKQLESLFNIVKKIEDAELGEAVLFSQEEVDAMISSSEKINRDDFFATTDGFVYLGDSMNDLRDTIMESNQILLGQQTKALVEKVKIGEIVEKDDSKGGLGSLSWETVNSWGPKQIQEFYKAAVNNIQQERNLTQPSYVWDPRKTDLTGTLLEGTNVNLIKEMYSADDPTAIMAKYGLTVEQFIYGALNEIADAYLGLGGTGGYKDQLSSGLNTLKEQNLSLMTGQEMIDMIGTKGQYGEEYTTEDIDRALAAQARIEGTTISGYEMGQQINQQVGQQAYDSAIAGGATADKAAEAQQKAMNEALEESHRLGQALALDAAKNRTEFKNLTSIFDNYTSTITKANRGSEEYKKGLSKIQEALKDVYGIDISEEFMLNHAEVLERVLAGEEGAWEEYTQLLIEETVKSIAALEGAGKAVLNLDNIASTISPVVGVTTTYNGSGIVAAQLGLQELAGQAVTTEDQMASLKALYELMGATITFTTETQYLNGTTWTKEPVPGGKAYTVITGVNITNTGGNVYRPSGGGGGGGGSSQEWENPYDEFYNTVEKINEELRKREKLELRYQRLLDRNAATAAEIQKLTREQLASLDVERNDREGLLRNRKRQMSDIESEYSDVGEYAWYNEETGQIEIDWAKLEALDGSTDEELTARVEEYISKLEDQQDLIEEEEEALEEINDAVWAIFEQGKDEYFDLEEQIKEAIIADRQREIDKLSEINDSITDSSSRLLDSMQEQIDEYRQNRDNQKTEEEIAEKQRRLAYLQQDTSGANALEILQLQEEIDEAQESHTDSLIDQKITELQQQNDKAAEQRQQQIEIMQAQLDQYSESEEIWEEVNQLMEEGLDPESGLVRGSRLEELLKDEAGFSGMSKLKKMDWLNELNKNVALALAWLEGGGAMQHLIGQGNEVTFTNKDGEVVTGTVNENGDVEVRDANGNVIGIYEGEDFVINSDGTISSKEGADDAAKNIETEEEEDQDQGGDTPSWPSNLTKPSNLSETVTWGSSKSAVKSVQTALKYLDYNPGTIDGIYGPKTQAAIKQFQRDAKTKGWNPNIGNADGIVGPRTKQAFKAVQYKTGGLADFTGPAWLDGTKSKPEYILNADQTKAFFNLVDVLSSLRAQPSGNSTENNGDNTYDIDINVETMSSDYDVEQLAEKIKNMINADARYRNNNAVNLMR